MIKQAALRILKDAAGISFKPVFRTYDDLDPLAGTWSEDLDFTDQANGDFHIGENSVLIDVGTTNVDGISFPVTDLDGNHKTNRDSIIIQLRRPGWPQEKITEKVGLNQGWKIFCDVKN